MKCIRDDVILLQWITLAFSFCSLKLLVGSLKLFFHLMQLSNGTKGKTTLIHVHVVVACTCTYV